MEEWVEEAAAIANVISGEAATLFIRERVPPSLIGAVARAVKKQLQKEEGTE